MAWVLDSIGISWRKGTLLDAPSQNPWWGLWTWQTVLYCKGAELMSEVHVEAWSIRCRSQLHGSPWVQNMSIMSVYIKGTWLMAGVHTEAWPICHRSPLKASLWVQDVSVMWQYCDSVTGSSVSSLAMEMG